MNNTIFEPPTDEEMLSLASAIGKTKHTYIHFMRLVNFLKNDSDLSIDSIRLLRQLDSKILDFLAQHEPKENL